MSACENCPGYGTPDCCERQLVKQRQRFETAAEQTAKLKEIMQAMTPTHEPVNRQQRRAAASKSRKAGG